MLTIKETEALVQTVYITYTISELQSAAAQGGQGHHAGIPLRSKVVRRHLGKSLARLGSLTKLQLRGLKRKCRDAACQSST